MPSGNQNSSSPSSDKDWNSLLKHSSALGILKPDIVFSSFGHGSSIPASHFGSLNTNVSGGSTSLSSVLSSNHILGWYLWRFSGVLHDIFLAKILMYRGPRTGIYEAHLYLTFDGAREVTTPAPRDISERASFAVEEDDFAALDGVREAL
ncbi:hypothetical protein QBC47DRAFT_362073 [Echria macrotheca]|uniref:Uncharacterized protein n=1 Tax=Echria macrotheca TaxID=438768 RepID=A0AAJ0F872_9PEZI|nr:hypothetical protein QBC47DRAFT_362073 [Echria macrotheca]